MLPPTIPIFPLPNVVLFPNVFLPLHIFEPRYRAMSAAALESDRIIGMALLRPGWERDYDGRPPVYAVGCAGLITHAERLGDGRYNIVLQGLEKFRIDRRGADTRRIASPTSTSLEEPVSDAETRRDARGAAAAGSAAGAAAQRPRRRAEALPATMADDDLVNALAQYLELEPVEKQALLERAGPARRAADR